MSHMDNLNDKGLTLIEVLASIVLLSLLAASVMTVFPPVAGWISTARRVTLASSYAAAVLEGVRSSPNQIDSLYIGKTAQEMFPDAGFPWNGMTDEITRMQLWDTYPNLYEITVKVSWYEGADQHCMELSTIIRKE